MTCPIDWTECETYWGLVIATRGEIYAAFENGKMVTGSRSFSRAGVRRIIDQDGFKSW